MREVFLDKLEQQRQEIKSRFDNSWDLDKGWVRANTWCRAVIATIEKLYHQTKLPDDLAVIAVGGTGRGEMAPFSDCDLLFLTRHSVNSVQQEAIESILYPLWDMGLKTGHAVRSLDEAIIAAMQDQHAATALLDRAFICGSMPLYTELNTRFDRDIRIGKSVWLVNEKLRERDERHSKNGHTAFLVEPNIKEGKGGLRDIHCAAWVSLLLKGQSLDNLNISGLVSQDEWRRLVAARSILWTMRCALHDVVGRAEERLGFESQPAVAALLGYHDSNISIAVERMMKRYFRASRDIDMLTNAVIQRLQTPERKDRIAPQRFSVFTPTRKTNPSILAEEWVKFPSGIETEISLAATLKLCSFAVNHQKLLHPSSLDIIARRIVPTIGMQERRNRDHQAMILAILTGKHDPSPVFRQMVSVGLFSRFYGDFGRIMGQMQFDMYHAYTVDEHTIRALCLAHQVAHGRADSILNDAMSLAQHMDDTAKKILIIAALLHDIAKGRGGDHSVLGEEVAYRICPRLGLDSAETDLVAWLVRNHLALSQTAQRRDLDDTRTISDFAALVQSPERLRLLSALTMIDIAATGPDRLTHWKASLIRVLTERCENFLLGDLVLPESRYHDDMDWLLSRAQHENGLAVHVEQQEDAGVTCVTVCAMDHLGLFSQIAAGLALIGANVIGARIATRTDGWAIDQFTIQGNNGKAILREDLGQRLLRILENILLGSVDIHQEISRSANLSSYRKRVFSIAPRVVFDNDMSQHATFLEVNAFDRPGLLYAITDVLFQCEISIKSAKIDTWGARAVDCFVIHDAKGRKLSLEKQEMLRQKLLMVLTSHEK